MIQSLVDAAVARLREELGQVLPDAASRVVAGPAAAPEADALPLLVLSPGEFQVEPAPAETSSGGPRPQPARQEFALAAGSLGPFALDHQPLPGSARGRLVLAEGTVSERGEPLMEGHHFTIDRAASTVTFTADLAARTAEWAEAVSQQIQGRVGRSFNPGSPRDLSAALFGDLKLPTAGEPNADGYYSTARAVLEPLRDRHPVVPLVLAYRELKAGGGAVARLDYAFAGIFSIREFRQAMVLEAYDSGPGGAERWGSLAAAVLLTWSDELLAAGTSDHPSRKSVSARQQPTRIDLVDGAAERFDAGTRMRMAFRVGGRLTVSREQREGLAIIEQIRSPGSTSRDPLAIDVEIA